MTSFELSIGDTNKVIDVLAKSCGYDFHHYTFYPLKRSIERCMNNNNFRDAEILIRKLTHDKNFLDEFLKEVSVESTEMFRDPPFWRYLKETTLPSLIKNTKDKINVWFPFCSSGDELYSFMILLKEAGLTENFRISASGICQSVLQNIKSGSFRAFKSVISTDNYKNFQGTATFENYFIQKNGQAIRDASLIAPVELFIQSPDFRHSPKKNQLIIYRNKLIYFNQTRHDQALGFLHESLAENGLLAIGIREKIGTVHSVRYKAVFAEEGIYKKIG